ncbi:MAG: TolC family protein [Selenomonas ruminantium]|nr:TolC family protein [Selenomonas ruminantium]
MKRKQLRMGALALTMMMGGFFPSAVGSCAELSLDEAIEMALAQNTALKVTKKGEDTAEAKVRQAKGSNGVSASLSDNLTTRKIEGASGTNTNNLSLSGSLPIYTGGKNQASIKSSEIGVDTARLATERGQENLKFSVIKAYYDALEAKKTIEVDQESVDNYQAHLTNVQQLYSAGSKAKIDVLRSSVELSNARQTLIKAQNSYEVKLANLRNYLNMDRDEPLTLTTDFFFERFDTPMSEAIAYAYGNRKDLQADAYVVEQRELDIKAAKAGFLPTVSLSVGAGQENAFGSSSSSSNNVSAGLGVSWNIFDSGVTKAKVDEAKIARDVARLNLQKDQETADLTLRTAYYNMREAERRLDSTGDAVGQAEEDYYIAKEKYRAGEGLMLDIIDTQLALSTAQLNHISAQYDYARYKAEVENAMGISLTDKEQAAADRLLADEVK